MSKASISTNARLWERLEILERHTLPNDRRDYYRMAENPWEQFFEVARRRMKKMIDTLDNSLNQLPEEMDEAHRQLGRWREFYSFLSEDIDRSVLLWREHVARFDVG